MTAPKTGAHTAAAKAEAGEDDVVVALGADEALTAALAAAQGAFPRIERNHTAEVRGKDGKQGYSYSYADLGDVLAAVRPVLAEHGIAVVQRTRPDGGKVILKTELRHVGGGILDTIIEINQSTASPQQFGGALTYLRRYELVTLLGIAAEEDRDAQDVEPPRNGGQAPPPAELPGWAKPTTTARKSELGEALIPLIGRDRTVAFLKSVEGSLGSVPDVVIAAAKLLGELVVDTPTSELTAGKLAIVDARQDAAEVAKASEAQDAAEGPDKPGPDAEAPDAEPTPAEAAQEAARKAGGLEEEPHEPDVPDDPAPGSIEKPDLEGANDDEVATALRALGCTCPAPAKPDTDVEAHDDACPIKGHGIPF